MAHCTLATQVLPALVAWAGTALFVSACDEDTQRSQHSQDEPQQPPAPKEPPPPPPPWFVSTWKGTAQLEGQLPAPLADRKDLGKTIEEPPKLQGKLLPVKVVIDEERKALGDLDGQGQVWGALHDETLRVKLHLSEEEEPEGEQPQEASQMLRGIYIGRKTNSAFEGTLKLSSGDSQSVLHGPLRLAKPTAKEQTQ